MYREHSVMDYSSVTLTGQMELDEEGNYTAYSQEQEYQVPALHQ